MGPLLFNLLTKLRQAKDLIVVAGPTALDSIANVLGRLKEGAEQTAQFIRDYGPLVQFAPGQGFDGEQNQQYLADLDKLYQEVEAEINNTPPSLPPRDGQMGLLDRLSKISPEMKQALLKILSDLLLSILTRAQIGGLTTPAMQQRSTTTPKHE